MNTVTLPAFIAKLESKADGSVKIVVETREFSDAELTTLFGYRNKEGYLSFSPNKVSTLDIPKEPADSGLGNKTPSQRFRGVLWKLWEQKGKPETFENYYATTMEKLIDMYKEKLDDN